MILSWDLHIDFLLYLDISLYTQSLQVKIQKHFNEEHLENNHLLPGIKYNLSLNVDNIRPEKYWASGLCREAETTEKLNMVSHKLNLCSKLN